MNLQSENLWYKQHLKKIGRFSTDLMIWCKFVFHKRNLILLPSKTMDLKSPNAEPIKWTLAISEKNI